MQIDNNALRKIMTMEDRELKALITAIAGERGLSLPNISASDLAKIRSALGSMSPADVEALERNLKNKGDLNR
jgi:hypothetical protein